MCEIVVIASFPSRSSVFCCVFFYMNIFFSTWPWVDSFLLEGPLHGELLPLASPPLVHLQELCLYELHWNKLGESRSFIGDQANLTREGEGGLAGEPVDVLVDSHLHLAQFVKKKHQSGQTPPLWERTTHGAGSGGSPEGPRTEGWHKPEGDKAFYYICELWNKNIILLGN